MNTKPDVSACCQSGPLKRSRCESKTSVDSCSGVEQGQRRGQEETWILKLKWVPGPCHSSFLAGTRVRAMMMGTRAREAMKRAHRGR